VQLSPRYGAEDRIENVHLQTEGHDCGLSKREAAYRFMAKHLRLRLSEVLDINRFVNKKFLTNQGSDESRVFTKKNPRPAHAIEAIEELH
jgi:hypothetical protein